MVTRERIVPRALSSARRSSPRDKRCSCKHRRVERIADLVREAERERAHGGKRFGVGRAPLERAALGDVDPDAVDRDRARRRASRTPERCQRMRRTPPFESTKPRFELRRLRAGDRLPEAIAIFRGDVRLHERLADGASAPTPRRDRLPAG